MRDFHTKDFCFFRQQFSKANTFSHIYTQPEKKNFFFFSLVIRHFDFSRRELFFLCHRKFSFRPENTIWWKTGAQTLSDKCCLANFSHNIYHFFGKQNDTVFHHVFGKIAENLHFCGGQNFRSHTRLYNVKHSTETEFRD